MDITIVLPVSRENFLKQVFTNLEFMDCDREHTHLLVYVDGDPRLYEAARRYTVNSKFSQKLCIYRSKGLPNPNSVIRRRQRIAAIHNELKTLINPCDYIFMLEDDTLFPNNTIQKLVKNYAMYPYAGFISAMELGRWGVAYIGGWKVNDPYDIHEIKSIDDGNDLIEVDAAGFYCQFTTYKNYINYEFAPFENLLGPDFNFGITLRRQGYKNYIDQSIKCRHLTLKGEVAFGKDDITGVTYTKEGNKWQTGFRSSITI